MCIIWDRLAPRYDTLLRPFHWRETQLAIAEGISGSILEAGCGTAQLTLDLLERGLDVFGCDTSLAMLDMGRRKLVEHGHEPSRLLMGNILRLPYLDHSYDFGLVTGVLCLLPSRDQRLALREMLRVCRRGLRLLEPVSGRSSDSWAGKLMQRLLQLRSVHVQQFQDMQIDYRIGWSTSAGLFSYIQVDKR